MLIDFFTKESQTSLFVQDVLSSVNYDIKVFDPAVENQVQSAFDEKDFAPIVIWDLDSFVPQNERMLETIRLAQPDSTIFAYAEDIAPYTTICSKYADISMNAALVRVHLMSKISQLKDIVAARKTFRDRMSHLVGKSQAVEQLRKTIMRAIVHTGPVLIQGETGVGKEIIARAVACVYDKFITVNCSAIPDNLFESELFGHTRGAFTGALSDRVGLFESADGGAIFLDEIGDMPLHAQVKLLRVLQNKEIRPIGANKSKHIDVRIIAATNRNLKQAVKEGKFREDLYYRLNVIPLKLSPLRERKEDIEDLANYFIQQYQGVGENYTLSEDAIDFLQNHSWPGNIRELENVIQRALCFSNPGELHAQDFQFDDAVPANSVLASDNTDATTYDDFREKQLDQERKFLIAKIQENNGSISQTAQKLGMIRTALYNRLSRIGVDVKNIKNVQP